MAGLFDTRLYRARAAGSDRARRIDEILARGIERAGAAGGLADLAGELSAGPEPDMATLARAAHALAEHGEIDDHSRVAFWFDLSRRRPQCAAILACHGDALWAAGRVAEAASALVRAVERQPGLLDDLADDVAEIARSRGGRLWLRFRLAELGNRLDGLERALAGSGGDPDSEPDDDERDGPDLRERYSELLEEHAGDPAALRRIRALGARITALEAAGVLPKTFVRRGSWRGREE